MAGIDRVLIVDDEPVLRDVLSTLLEQHGYVTHSAASATEAIAVLGEEEVDLVLLDIMLPDTSGLEVLPKIKAIDPHIPVIMMTAYSSVESAIEAMRLGAFHYVPKPFKHEEVLHIIRQALERRHLQAENLRLRSRLEGMGEIIGTSRAMQEVFELVRRAAPARSNILVVGESGTGKELVARAIHRLSPRTDKPFIPVHTSAIPADLLESTLFGHVKGAFTGAVASKRGLFEAAHEGTLFLDEVGTISPDTQTKLLRVIQEREFCRVGSVSPLSVDVRFISATNVNLWDEVQAGRFREDLFYRLNVISIELPPLRERREDVPILATHFLRTYAEENNRTVEGFDTDAMDAIVSYAWPGNVRELENVVERAVVLCRSTTIGMDLLPPPLRDTSSSPRLVEEVGRDGIDFKAAVADYQRRLIRAALEEADGVQRQAARLLSISPTTLNEMIRRLDVGHEG